MVFLLELREKYKRFYSKYDVYILPIVKFILALISLIRINTSIGYMTKLKNPFIALLISVVCAFLPSGAIALIISVFMLAHLYAISAEFAAIAFCILILMYLLYFRFTPKKGYLLIITALLCSIKMPYIVPIAAALYGGALSAIPVSFGIIIYYIIMIAASYNTAISTQSAADSLQQISYFVANILGNKDLLVLLIASVVTIVIVAFIKRLSVNNAWTYAIVVGGIVELVAVIIGQLILSSTLSLVFVLIGVVLGMVGGYICQVLFFSVDYKRTEFVQYEDDEYYYYVKAVPKISLVNAELKVKQINARNTRRTDEIKKTRNEYNEGGESFTYNDDEITFIDK